MKSAVVITLLILLALLWLHPWGSGPAELAAPPEASAAQTAEALAAAQPREVAYVYDAAGRLVRADYGSKSIAYTYDRSGNLLRREAEGALSKGYLPLLLKQRR